MEEEKNQEYLLKVRKDGTKVTVRDVQLVILEMMKDVDEVCQKNGIEYCLTGGSNIGAAKYQGFIPWDDDLDMAMRYDQYPKFVEALKRDLDPDKYVIQCFETDRRFNIVAGPTMKIRKKGTYLKEVNVLLPNRCKTGDGIYIDVFVYNHMAATAWGDLPLRLCNMGLMSIISFFENLHINPIPLKHLFKFNAKLYGWLFRHSKYIGDEITWVYSPPLHPLRYIEKNMFPVVRMPFENLELPVPKDLREYLIRHYGEKVFQPLPESKRKPGHVADVNLTSEEREEE